MFDNMWFYFWIWLIINLASNEHPKIPSDTEYLIELRCPMYLPVGCDLSKFE